MISAGLYNLREYIRCCKDLSDIINSFRSLNDYHIYVINDDLKNRDIDDLVRNSLMTFKGRFTGINNDLKELNSTLMEASITNNRKRIRDVCCALHSLILDIDNANRTTVYLYACDARDDINNFIPRAKTRISEIILFINGKPF